MLIQFENLDRPNLSNYGVYVNFFYSIANSKMN